MPDNATPAILLTRPEAQAERFAASCRERFGDAVEIVLDPMQRIVLGPLPGLPEKAAMIFTSENGVRAYAAGGGAAGRMAYCVGDRTADAARAAGLVARSAGGATGELLDLIRSEAPKAPLVHLHGRHVRGNVVGALVDAGFAAQGFTVYDQQDLPLSHAARALLSGPRRVIAPLFSPRSAALLGAELVETANVALPCISAATRDALPPALHGLASIAETPTGAAMLNAVARQLCP